MRRINLLIVDDHQVVRLGLKSLLQLHPRMAVVGEAATGREALEAAGRLSPDIVLMDARLPDQNGIEVCREIRRQHPDIKVIILTSFSDEESIFNSILAGASGYLLKQADTDSLLRDIELVAQGESLLDPCITGKVFERIKALAQQVRNENPEHDQWAELTNQEKKVLLLITQGKTNREIAEDLFISEKTVRNYVSSILTKLHMHNRTQVAAFVASNGGREEP